MRQRFDKTIGRYYAEATVISRDDELAISLYLTNGLSSNEEETITLDQDELAEITAFYQAVTAVIAKQHGDQS